MNRRERVLTALAHRQPDRTPHHIGLTIPAREKLVAHYGEDRLDEALNNHFAFTGSGMPGGWREVRPDIWQDEWGVEWDRTVDQDIGTVCNEVITGPSLEGITIPDADDPRRYEHIAAFVAGNQDLVRFSDIGFSLFERAWTLRGMVPLMLDMIEHPDFVEELLDRICEHNLARIRNALAFDVDGMRFGDDWGQQRGLMMGAGHWRRFIKPRLARMYGAVRDADKFVMIHSCGDVKEIFPDLIEIGVDIFNPFQPEVMDVEWMKATYGGRISFYGGLSLQQTLPYGTPQDVADEIRRLCATVGKNGGFILSPSHAVTRDVPIENLVAMVETANE